MHKIKGFISIKALVNNSVGVISPLGEASTYSSTYTKEKGEYSNPAVPGFSLITTSSFETIDGVMPVSNEAANHIIAVAKWVYDFSTERAGTYNTIDLLNDLITAFPNVVTNPVSGTVSTNGDIWMPESLQWRNTVLGDYDIKVWFSDSAFRQQYDEYEILVVPPIDSLDNFFLSPNDLRLLLEARTPTQWMDKVALVKNKNPETVIRAETYDYVNVNIPNLRLPTDWYIVIYGEAGDNVDAVKDAIIAHILANSTHTRAEWEAILPDLFKSTEFVILPRWDKYAIPNMNVQAGIYSPIVNPVECISFAKNKIPEYPVLHVESKLRITTHPYRSVALLTVGGPENRDGKNLLTDHFPDYITVGTQSLDFARMAQDTQDWLDLLERLLIVAENMTPYSDVPLNVRKMRRGNMLYVVARFKNVQYLVAAKVNYPPVV